MLLQCVRCPQGLDMQLLQPPTAAAARKCKWPGVESNHSWVVQWPGAVGSCLYLYSTPGGRAPVSTVDRDFALLLRYLSYI